MRLRFRKDLWVYLMVAGVCSLSFAAGDLIEQATLTMAPHVPPAITRKKPALVKVKLDTLVSGEIRFHKTPNGSNRGNKSLPWTFRFIFSTA